MNEVTELRMAVDATFSSILNEIQLSRLNFFLQITLFAAYITLKKSVIKNQYGIQAVPSPPFLFLLQQAQQTIAELHEENKRLKIEIIEAEKSNESRVYDNAALVEALQVSNDKLTFSNTMNNTLHGKLDVAEEKIQKLTSEKNTIETNLKDTKKSHLHEIKDNKSIIKSLEKDFGKEIHNLKRNLESSRDSLKNLKTEHSSLKIKK